jgi:hypothetical protein
VEEDEMVGYILNGLDGSYNSLVFSVNSIPGTTLDDLIRQIGAHDMRKAMVVETDQDNDFTLSANVAAHCGWDTHHDNLPRGYHGRYADLGDRVVIMVTAVITMTLTAMFAAGKDNVKMIEDAMSMVMMEIMITVIAVLTMVMAADAMMTEGAAAMVVVSIMDTVVQPPLFNVTCEICNMHVHPESNFWWVYRDDSDDDGNGDEKGAHVASYIVGTNWYSGTCAIDNITRELNKLSTHKKYKRRHRVHTIDGHLLFLVFGVFFSFF